MGAMTVLASEFLGTTVLLALGLGVSMNLTLRGTHGNGPNALTGAMGWGLAVFCAVFVASPSGAHLNPAFTVAKLMEGAGEFAPGIPVAWSTTLAYLGGQHLGALVGACVAWFIYRQHLDATADPNVQLHSMVTFPGIRRLPQNAAVEAVATLAFVFVVLSQAATPTGLGPLAVALVVMAIGLALGGPTGWSINPARDLMARVAHSVLPMSGKGASDWSYWWPPVIGPYLGGLLGGLVAAAW